MIRLPTIFGIWVILLIFQLPTFAQYQETIDSLLIELKTAAEDTNKVHIYRGLSWSYAATRTETTTARAYADSILWLSEKLGFEKGAMRSHLYYGLIDRFEGNYMDALDHLEKYVKYFKEKGDLKLEAFGWFQIGAVQMQLGDFDKSMVAQEYVLKNYEERENWNGVVATLNSIGIIYKKIGKYNQAIETYQKAIALNDRFNLGRDLTYIRSNMGNAYSELKEYDKALNAYQKSLKIANEFNSQPGIAINLTNIGGVYNMMNRHERALTYYLKALGIYEKLAEKSDIALNLLAVGGTYTELKRPLLAEEYLLRGLKLAKELGIKPSVLEAYDYLSDLYASTKDFSQAYKFKELYHALNDSIFSKEKVNQINELQTKYETAQKDQEIALLTKENEVHQAKVERQATLRNALIGGVISLLLIAGLIFYTMRQRLKSQKLITAKNEEIKVSHLKEELKTLEMKALRAQMNPHFLFNSLNSINTMIIKDEKDDASRYLTKFSKLVRLMLENSEQPKVTLKDELDMLGTYIQLESSRFENKMDYQIKVAPSIDTESTYLPSMVLQPFVENAIWHGLLHNEDKGLLTIDIKEEDDYLQCSIIDNGIGREESLKVQKQTGFKKKSMGIKITADRLKLLTRQTVKELVKIIDLKDNENNSLGTQVNVLIPIA